MNNLFEKKDVNIIKLSLELETAVIDHVLQDDERIYVTEIDFYPYWIQVLESRGFVGLSTFTLFKASTTRRERLEFCNKINGQYFLINAYIADDDTLRIDHMIPCRSGIIRENFVRTCRQFSRNIVAAINEHDPDNQIILNPGEVESVS